MEHSKDLVKENDSVKTIVYDKLVNYSSGIIESEYKFDSINPPSDWEVMERTKNNYAWKLLKSNRPFVGHAIIYFKKVIRRCLKWYLEPVCDQQTQFNNASVNCSMQLKEHLDITDGKIEKLSEQFENTQKILHDLDDKILQLEYIKKQFVNVDETLDRIKKYDFYTKGDSTKLSYSQSGEDSIVAYIFSAVRKPLNEVTYLDLGANHAKELSNTYYLYLNGARGVLVEANPNLIPELKLIRGEDTVINRCIGNIDDLNAKFYLFNGDGLSTSDYESAKQIEKINPYLQIVETMEVPSITVSTILNKYFLEAPDVINLDIEGLELDILNELDFKRYRPLIFIVETIPYKPTIVIDEKRKDILDFFMSKGYAEYAFTGINSIFVDKVKLEEMGR